MELVTVWWPVYPLAGRSESRCVPRRRFPRLFSLRERRRGWRQTFASSSKCSAPRSRRRIRRLALSWRSEKLAVAGRISASISHEIKNPLETAGNLLYLLAADPRMPSDLVAMAKTASSELQRADEIAQSNLSLLRKSSAPVQVSLAELVDSVLDLQTAQLIGHGISLQRRLRAPLPLKAYSSELRQILINLIQNAMAAIGSRGRIMVRVQLRRSLVANSGEGNRLDSPDIRSRSPIPGRASTLNTAPSFSPCSLPPKGMRARGWGFGWCVPWWRSRVGGSAFAPALPRNAISPGRSSISGYRWNQHLLQPQQLRKAFRR